MTRARQAALLFALAMTCAALATRSAGILPPFFPPAPAFAQQPAGQGIAAGPQFTLGLVLRYQLDVRTTHDGDVSGAVENPQGGNRLTVRFGAVLKLEALEPAPEGLLLRATIEQISVAIGGDTFDPAVVGLERRYRQLEGYSVIFHPRADIPPVPVASDPSLRNPELEATAQNWMRLLVSRIGAPPGAVPGSAWSDEQPVAVAPFKATVLRTASSYLRDEPCGGQGERAAVAAPSLAAEQCAVVLTRSTIVQAGSHRDPTPDSYRERGLRTAGRWAGTGEGLAYIAQRTGWVVSVTETQAEQMDFTVSRANGDVVLRRRGTVETQTHLLLQSVESRK